MYEEYAYLAVERGDDGREQAVLGLWIVPSNRHFGEGWVGGRRYVSGK